ncbi:MAG: sialate O-acetylesterase [Planctomycetota bacterium]|nr:sialate O-acetylesterase [Planctomycetota bacterium]MDA1211760.1 sialate O-acetylesterase [Planctomycetota bacterium]
MSFQLRVSSNWARRWLAGLMTGTLFVLAFSSSASADVRLPTVVGSNMVLQRDKPIHLWGWAAPDEKVTVTLGDDSKSTAADAEGNWAVDLNELPAGGPHQISITGNNAITLENILVGEVWVCSGQSNMEWMVRITKDGEQEIAAAQHPKIRLFHIPKVPSGTPQDNVNAAWVECSPETIPNFSAVSYYFGRHLNQELDIPIGLINTSWGGTRIEPWTTINGFKSVPALSSIVDMIAQANTSYVEQTAATIERMKNDWLPKAQAAAAAGEPIPAPPAWPNHALNANQQPTGLYNGMVHAIRPLAVRGAIWYQGESNLADGMLYHEKMKALIHGWREFWGEEMPFYFVQLAPFKYGTAPDLLPKIWEAQTATLAVPHTGMAVITDITTLNDIHPPNKQDVGKRLALWALAKTYGKKDLVYSGPLFESLSIKGNKAILSFAHVGGGLVSRDGQPLSLFTIAGENGEFVPAEATIEGETIVVTSDQVEKPKAVRFGWDQLAEPNLMNKEGLPASPFRTDK